MERCDDYKLPPPPDVDLSQAISLDEIASQHSHVPITQTVEEEKKEDLSEEIRRLVTDKLKEFRQTWRTWTLIDRPSTSVTNQAGQGMLVNAVSTFIDSVIMEASEVAHQRVFDWLSGLDDMWLFEIARAVVLFLALVVRFESVINVNECVDKATLMGVTFYWDLVAEVARDLGIPPRARWFWRITSRIVGLDHMSRVGQLWQRSEHLKNLDIEMNNWSGFADNSPERESEVPEDTQNVINHINADSMLPSHLK